MGKNVAVSTFWIYLHTHVYNMEFFGIFWFWNNISYSPGWPWKCPVGKDGLELLIVPPAATSCMISTCQHNWLCVVLGIKPRALHKLIKHSVNWSTSQASLSRVLFSTIFFQRKETRNNQSIHQSNKWTSPGSLSSWICRKYFIKCIIFCSLPLMVNLHDG